MRNTTSVTPNISASTFSALPDVTIRDARDEDRDAIVAVFGSEPSDEQIGIAGDAERAQRLRAVIGRSLVRPESLAHTRVAVRDGRVVGMLQSGDEAGERVDLRVVLGVLCIFGFGVLDFLRRDRARAAVQIRRPADSLHIAEVHVLAAMRGAGIGAALLADVEHRARAAHRSALSLTTTTSNPARRLYERAGFSVIETREDPTYRALTGIAGRVLMVKRLG
jgi:ribosomal protein S18 acetylase RimI-like enzyme